MPLPTGGHVKIGDHEFIIDKSEPEHYIHSLIPVEEDEKEIHGEEGKRHLRKGRKMWSITDWGGGEGNRLWYRDDPSVYDYSDGLNGRIPGQLTGRPARDVVSVNTSDQRDRHTLLVADGAIWVAGATTTKYSEDGGATWTNKNTGVTSPLRITAAVGDHEFMYYTAGKEGGARIVRRVDIAAAAEDVVASATPRALYAGMALMNGRLYAWTGRRLFEHDIFETMPLASSAVRKVHDTGVDPATTNVFSTHWFADAVATENSVVYFYSTDAQSNVYEYKNGVPRPMWRAPLGFTIKSIVYQNGIVFFAGHWGGDSHARGRGALYAIPIDSRRVIFVGWFRKHQNVNLQMQEMAQSYGSQILLCAAFTGRIFVYDADLDAVSLVDDLNTDGEVEFESLDHRIGQVLTFGTKRLALVYRPGAGVAGTAVQVVRYEDDEPPNRQSSPSGGLSTSLEVGEHDYDYPFDIKTLLAFHVVFKPLTANQRIRVSYKWDQGSAWTDMDWITSATAGSSEGRVVQVLAVPTKGYRLKLKLTLDTNATAGILQPILYGVSAEARVVNYEEFWDMIVRVKDEHQGNGRPRNRAWLGEQIRDELLQLGLDKVGITFLDGFRYASDPKKYSTHTVTVEKISDVIMDQPGEGVLHIRLKGVPT